MSPSPTISVITPSFRQLDWLKLCAASIADQSGVRFEHIVQDAGSGPELEAWAAQQPQLRLFVERDEGMYDAINRGLRRATGDICCYLNCDEQYLPGALARVADYFAAHPEIDVVFGDAIVTNAEGRPVCYRQSVLPQPWHTRLSPLSVLTCVTFFRRSVVERGHLFNPKWKVISDSVWIHGLLSAGVPMGLIDAPLASFTLTGDNLSNSRIALPELDSWRHMADAPSMWWYWPVRLHYRWRKWRAGGYRPRRLTLDLYSPTSPRARQHWGDLVLSNRWPKETS